jgi:hypothetical protein
MNGQAWLLLLCLATAVDGARGAADATPYRQHPGLNPTTQRIIDGCPRRALTFKRT